MGEVGAWLCFLALGAVLESGPAALGLVCAEDAVLLELLGSALGVVLCAAIRVDARTAIAAKYGNPIMRVSPALAKWLRSLGAVLP